jgi:hypothetical protein
MGAFPLSKPARGRPRKFSRPARPVTVTLPEDVLERLGALNPDLGRAIVTLVERRRAQQPRAVRHAEISSYGKHAVIVVTPLRSLKRLPGVQLVPIADGRCLISLDRAYSAPRLELDIHDAVGSGQASGSERKALESLGDILRRARADRGVNLTERTIIVLEARRPPRRRGAPARVP